VYVSDPRDTFSRAIEELTRAKASGDELGVRQAAEKAWLAVVEATDQYLLRNHNIRVSPDERAHSERRRYLHMLGKGDLERNYGYLSQTLHGDIFYLGEPVSPGRMRGFLEEAATFVEETTGTTGLVQLVRERVPAS
jgi:hypothetical protein